MVCDALRVRWRDPDAQRNGRPGQRQHGVDIFGTHRGRRVVAQCRLVQRVRVQEIEEVVKQAKWFEPTPSKLYFVVSLPRDARLQGQVRLLNERRRSEKKFEVGLLFAEDVYADLASDPGLVRKYGHLRVYGCPSAEPCSNVVVLSGSKGGVGRTTVSLQLALALAEQGKRTLMVSADRYADYVEALRHVAYLREIPFPAVERIAPHQSSTWNESKHRRGVKRMLSELRSFARVYDYVLVDCERDLWQLDASVAGGAGTICLLTSHSPLDLWGVKQSARRLRRLMSRRPDLRGVVLLNQTVGSSTMRRDNAYTEIAKWGVPLLDVSIRRSARFDVSLTLCRSVLSVAPLSNEADDLRGLLRALGLPVVHTRHGEAPLSIAGSRRLPRALERERMRNEDYFWQLREKDRGKQLVG
jgi:cellulose biosynthesis protein BcsQ